MPAQFNILIPELALILLALFSQFFAVIFTNKNKIIANITILLSIIIVFLVLKISGQEAIAFNNSFATNAVTSNYKALVLVFTILTMLIYFDYCTTNKEQLKNEFFTLLLLSTAGIFAAISARNFLLLFCAMELSALIAYVLAGFKLKDISSSEGALKYFILGSLVTCLSLFGISFIYGFSGSLEFSDILYQLNNNTVNIGLIVGVIFFLSSLFFKLASVPLHSWAPDVYEGSPISSVTYFATASKIGIIAVLLNVMNLIIGDYHSISVNLVKIIAVLSMIFGALGALRQTSLKRLMAYSSILNIGYVLVGVALHSNDGDFAAMLYMMIYAVGVLGFFACLLALLGNEADNATFESIKGAAANHKALAAAISIIMFSMIGIPPLAGFLGKYYLFYQAINQGEYLLAFIGIFTSVIAAYYYLKIIKTMYFVDNNILTDKKISVRYGLLLINFIVIGFLLFASFFIKF
ncbi:NADH-quinone oxidoreductase subunit NuoN [Rickettsia endosymbiont of Halotydeus destructor]|uniref:NADH-quinone oxidoreductase subunit NuoN n=1 Tax=Rickettsia endosymbiont of Halotydeus destructor TaxID=2996754 RepID=UPI003BB16AE2